MAKKSKPGKKTWIRIIALIMSLLLVGSAIYASLITLAYAETTVNAMYDAGNAALAASQSTSFVNDTGERLSRLPFALYLNALRRTDALPAGPGGVEIYNVLVNGESADWSATLDECKIMVDCDIAPGDEAVIEFEYAVMLPESGFFAGTGDMGARLSFFYPAILLNDGSDFIYCQTTDFTVPMFFPEDGYTLNVSLPYGYIAVAGAAPEITQGENGSVYGFHFDAARDVSLAIGRRYTSYASDGAFCYTNNARAAKIALDAANYAIRLFNDKLGGNIGRVDIVQTDIDMTVQAHSGVVWLGRDVIVKGDIEKATVFGVAKQYFTQSVLADPENDAWLNEALCGYLTCLYYNERYSLERFKDVLNSYALSALSTTIPGGIDVNGPLSGFSSLNEYEAVALGRGVAVINEIRQVMGFDGIWSSLKTLYGDFAHKTCSTRDFADALSRVRGSDMSDILYDFLDSISEYINQSPERLD